MMRSPRRTVSRWSAECVGDPRFAVARRLVDGLRANSFTSLRFAATHRIAVLAKECAQSKRGIRPPIGLRTDATPYRPASHRAAHRCDPLQALFFFGPFRAVLGVYRSLSFVPKGYISVISPFNRWCNTPLQDVNSHPHHHGRRRWSRDSVIVGARVRAGLGGCAELRQPLRALVTRCVEPLGRHGEWATCEH